MKKKSKLNEFIQHTIDSESYGNITKDEAVRLLQTLYKEISNKLRSATYVFSKKNYNTLLEEIESLINEYKSNTVKLYEETISDITSYQSQWLKDFLSEAKKDIVIPASLLASIKFSPVANVTDYKGLVDNEVYKIRQNVEASLRTAYITKEEMNTVADRFEKREKPIERELIENTKMIGTATFSAVNYLMYKANHMKVVYCAILDSKTCIECGELNGKEFDAKDAPFTPNHYRCRCSLISKEALGEEEIPESFSDWFETLTEEEKIEAVGKGRYELYKRGIPVTSFVDSQYKLIPLKEVKAASDINKFPGDDVLSKYSLRIPNPNNYLDVAMHGTSKSVIIDGREVDHRELANIIKRNPKFSRQCTVRLLSCSTGKGEGSLAQNIANALGCKVIAPSDDLYIYPNGSMYIGENMDGTWIEFLPKKVN